VATTLSVFLVGLALAGFLATVRATESSRSRQHVQDVAFVARQQMSRDLASAERLEVDVASFATWTRGVRTGYWFADSTLLRDEQSVLAPDLIARSFRVQAVGVSGDTLRGLVDTRLDSVRSVLVQLVVGERGRDSTPEVAVSVDVPVWARPAWPERPDRPEWP